MRKIKEIVRLRIELGRTLDEVAKACGVGRTSVSECLLRVKAAGLSWPLPEDLDDQQLEVLLYPNKGYKTKTATLPEWQYIFTELKKKGVTRQLLWKEYLEQNPYGIAYSQFCDKYKEWLSKSKISMKQHHTAGEKLFVDFAGTKMPILDPKTGEKKWAEIFVATWGASNYTFARAVWSQDLSSWTESHVKAFEYFGCVPEIIVPDNLKSGVNSPCRYDPEINETYVELAKHYGCAVIPAHVRKPKHKSKVEFGVLLVTRWILARLRKRRFFSIEELNEAILESLEDLNRKPFQKMPGSRKSAFISLDKPAAKPLPIRPYIYSEVKKAKVNIDYHVVIDDHFYSVPYQLRGKTIRVRITATTIEILHHDRRVCTHSRSFNKWQYTTLKDHMPRAHRDYAEWTPQRIIEWAQETGPNVGIIVTKMIAERDHPQQGFRASLGVIRLAKIYGVERLEKACIRALHYGAHRFRYIKTILEQGLDHQEPAEIFKEPITHENIRGGEYYQHLVENKSC